MTTKQKPLMVAAYGVKQVKFGLSFEISLTFPLRFSFEAERDSRLNPVTEVVKVYTDNDLRKIAKKVRWIVRDEDYWFRVFTPPKELLYAIIDYPDSHRDMDKLVVIFLPSGRYHITFCHRILGPESEGVKQWFHSKYDQSLINNESINAYFTNKGIV